MALTSKGLVDVLEQEMKDLGLKVFKKETAGVWFEGNWGACYKANLHLRTASRVILPILDFPAYQNEDLYHNILKHDFTKYIEPYQTIAVDASVRQSKFKDQRFVALKVKDAVVDQFREKFGERPNVETKNPHLKILVKVVKNQVSVSIDTSGPTLSMRGYRIEAGQAPLREHLAAGLLYLSGWDKKTPILDPMCGSGTILIEAAMMARNIAPGSLRKGFAFQNFKGFQKDVWDDLVDEALSAELEESPVPFYGFDKDRQVIRKARRNAEVAGVDEDIEIEREAVDMVTPEEGLKGIIVTNPPYGERLGDPYELEDTYRDISFALKGKFSGWTCFLLSGEESLTKFLKLKSTRKHPVYNGGIDCRLIEYKIN